VHQYFVGRVWIGAVDEQQSDDLRKARDGRKRKWLATAALLGLALLAWFTMDASTGETMQIFRWDVSAQQVRVAVVVIVLSFALRIWLIERRPRGGDGE
jgi:hypothetical protein